MADPDVIPETQSDPRDTQDSTEEDASRNARPMDSSLLSESQDFHLIDCEETPKETQEEIERVEREDTDKRAIINSEPAKESSAQLENVVESKLLHSSADENKKFDTDDITEEDECSIIENEDDPATIEKTRKTESSTTDIEKNEDSCDENNENDNDDDEFVQSSQIEKLSPLKKKISNLGGVGSQKRKADNSDDATAKFPRTCFQEDALSNARKRLGEETEELLTDEKVEDRNDDEIISSMIIREAEESRENIESGESLQQVEQELEEALSQNLLEDEDKKIVKGDDIGESQKRKEKENKEIIVEEKESSKMEIIEEASSDPEEISVRITEEFKATSVDSNMKELSTESVKESANIDDTKEKSISDIVEATSTLKNQEDDKNSLKADARKPEHCFVAPTSGSRSRMSIEVIYDRSTAPPEKKPPRELVEIDEDGEKIVLDSSQESCDRSMEKSTEKKIVDTSYNTCASTDYKSIDSSKDSSSTDCKQDHSLTNGSSESRVMNSGVTMTGRSDSLATDSENEKKPLQTQSPSKQTRLASSKTSDNPEILSISDSEESFIMEERTKPKERISTSPNHENSTIKPVPIEKELNILVKLKCLVYIDETTKEQVEKVVTSVNCEPAIIDFSSSRHRNSDNSANLADISSSEKDNSPSSVTSIPHPYSLNQRLSLASVASTSSSSSTGSLNTKPTGKKFQLPRGPAKHAKKNVLPESTMMEKRLENEDSLEQIKKEWKNIHKVTCKVLNYASKELANNDQLNGSALRVDNSLERIRSSTPEIQDKDATIMHRATPKRSAKRSRSSASAAGKTTRGKNLRSSDSNGLTTGSSVVEIEQNFPAIGRKRKSSPVTVGTPSRHATKDTASDSTINEEDEELVGRQVFAKWSDNKYYPGTVTGKTKTKYRVNFYDGQNKLMIEDFIVPMPITLNPGLSVYATTDEDNYGSCGIILEVKMHRDSVIYIVETDEGDKIEVDIKNIFLTNDQVQVLKEDAKMEMKSPPSTPKHLGKVTLENVIDGKRRSKRILTPVTTTPKGKRGRTSSSDKIADYGRPSASGTSGTSLSAKFLDNRETTSDSNYSESDDAPDAIGVQEEIIGTPNEQESKGQQSAIKGKGRGRKKSETPEVISNLGPMPGLNSDLFEGMSFILSCVPLDTMERYQERESSKESRGSSSDPGTENEEEWNSKPFVRDRLVAQLTAGGGKVYDTFDSIPPDEYKNTKHITNVPNTTRKSLLCLSAGIKSYNHQWVIRCCQQNRLVHPSEEQLPAGWSIMKKSYVEMFQRRNEKPFQTLPVIVVIPVTPGNREFVKLWQKICENAGGFVLLVEKPDDDFIQGTVVLTNKRCPKWVMEKASNWKIPIVSTVWVVQCLIEGEICPDDAHSTFAYNYVKKTSSHISQLKRR